MTETAFNLRQQQAVEFKASTVVSASAGTGKTRTLVGLYLKLLRSGLEPEDILAITFTDKAAAEMRDRVRHQILSQIGTSGEDLQLNTLWRQKLAKITTAPISTIHSFCGRLLRENALKANVDPLFDVMDEVTASGMRRAAVFETIHRLISSRDRRAQRLFRDFQLERGNGVGPRRLVEIVEWAISWLNGKGIDFNLRDEANCNWLQARWIAQQKEVESFEAQLRERVAEVRSAFQRIAAVERPKGKAAEKFVEYVRSNLGQIERALDRIRTNSSAEVATPLDDLFGRTKLGNLPGDPSKQRLLENLMIVRSALDPKSEVSLVSLFGAIKSQPLVEKLVWIINQCQERYEESKRESHSLSFDDLLLKARSLLKFDLPLRRACKQQFKAILVDEFQDTNEIQGEIVALLGEGLEREARFNSFDPYHKVLNELILAPDRLFIVGDAKQSIYRFRHANVSVFVKMKEKIMAGGGLDIHLVENYRSERHLLSFTNWLFSQVMDGQGSELLAVGEDVSHRIRFSDEDALVHPAGPLSPLKDDPTDSFSPMLEGITPGQTSPANLGQPPGEIMFLLCDPRATAAQGRAEEARAIACLIQNWMGEGKLSSYNQAVVLLRSRDPFEVYKSALQEKRIPTYLVKGGGLFERQESSDIISLLGFIQDPHDDLVLAEVLTSPFGALNFDDLMELTAFRRQAGIGTLYEAVLQARSNYPAWKDRLSYFSVVTDPLVYLRERLAVAEILESALEKSGYEGVLTAQDGGEQRLANVRKLVEMSRLFSRRGLASLDEFVRSLKLQRGMGNNRVAEAQTLGEEENVVRIMTVHQAKGLEFDSVVLPDIGFDHAGERGERVSLDEKYGIVACAAYGISRDRLPNRLFMAYQKREADKQFEEEKRLFYVAMTRAKRNLILGEGYARAPGVWKKWLHAAMTPTPESRAILEEVRRGQRTKAEIQAGSISLQVIRSSSLVSNEKEMGWGAQDALLTPSPSEQVLDRVTRWVPSPPASVELSASALAALAKCERYFYLNQIAGLSENPPAHDFSMAAMDLGNLVHAILKTYPVQAPATQISEMLDRLLKQTPKIRLLKSENERAVKDDLARFLRGPVWGRLAGNPSLQREVPFVIALRGDGLEVFVKGQIDALTIEEKGPLLLDFKYAFFDENHSANYALPLETYSLTLMKSLGFRTTETALVFLRERANGIISTTVGNPEQIEKRLISLAQAYQRKVFLNDMNVWQKIERNRCNTLKCGFRSYCWNEKEK